MNTYTKQVVLSTVKDGGRFKLSTANKAAVYTMQSQIGSGAIFSSITSGRTYARSKKIKVYIIPE